MILALGYWSALSCLGAATTLPSLNTKAEKTLPLNRPGITCPGVAFDVGENGGLSGDGGTGEQTSRGEQGFKRFHDRSPDFLKLLFCHALYVQWRQWPKTIRSTADFLPGYDLSRQKKRLPIMAVAVESRSLLKQWWL